MSRTCLNLSSCSTAGQTGIQLALTVNTYFKGSAFYALGTVIKDTKLIGCLETTSVEHRACTNISLTVGGASLGVLLNGGTEAVEIMLLLFLTHFLSALTTLQPTVETIQNPLKGSEILHLCPQELKHQTIT